MKPYRKPTRPPKSSRAERWIFHRANGNFWFVESLTHPEKPEVFVHGSKALDAFEWDEVEFVSFTGKFGKIEGRVTTIIERSKNPHFGIFHLGPKFSTVELFAEPGRHIRILMPFEVETPPKDKSTIGVTITGYGRAIAATLVQVLGNAAEVGYYQKLVIAESGVPTTFPKAVIEAARAFAPPTKADFVKRRDLTQRTIITIDGETAKDLDDAIEVEKTATGYRLSVHIADVTEYVQEWSVLDREAIKRGTSIYLADTVIPMLPGELSNHLCSLHPGSPKLCLSCTIELDEHGNTLRSEVYESVIHSKHRATYEEVQKIHDGEPSSLSGEIKDMLKSAWELKKLLDIRRHTEWKIGFPYREPYLTLVDGKLTNIAEAKHYESYELIEQFMVMANEEVARFAHTKKLPFLYRVHEAPPEEGLRRLHDILELHGISLQAKNPLVPTPKELQRVVELLMTKDTDGLLSKSIISSMSKAIYSEKTLGHFGLALAYYSHFTSPIRRYPDLQIHRILKTHIRGMDQKSLKNYIQILPDLARRCSGLERRAEKLEYNVRDTYICEWLKPQVGSQYKWRVTTILDNGYFVEILPFVEGFVSTSKYIKRQGHITTGAEINVTLVAVDILRRRIDLTED